MKAVAEGQTELADPTLLMEITKQLGQRNQEYLRLQMEGPKIKIRVAQTPSDIVWSMNKAKLYHYHQSQAQAKGPGQTIPLLLTYALINRAYILDLVPGKSLIEYLVKRGFDVYLLDWGNPGLEDKDLSFGDLIHKYLPKAIKRMQRISMSKEFSMLGYCMGGTIASMYAALYPNDGLKNLILLASPIDFSYHPYYSNWLRNKYFDVDRLVDVLGVIPAPTIDWGNKMLKPAQNFNSSEFNLWYNVTNEKFIKNWAPVNKWVNDGCAFPGEAFRQWIKDFYQDNKLVKNEVVIGGHLVKLNHITANLLAIGASQDHIVLAGQVQASMDFFGSQDKEYLEVDCGHVAITISRSAKKYTWPKIGDWLAER